MSLLLLAPTALVGRQRLTFESIRRDHENAVWLGVRNVDDSEVAARLGSTDRDARALVAQAVFAWIDQDLLHLGLRDVVAVDVGLVCAGVEVETQAHGAVASPWLSCEGL